ncbi:hypothetical protein CGLO_06483 [Colletotrichum gloeosporioides Cg-14]|uniref:Uncharacterized protein n=1 Tax=Colletotrichum gloeosporioides (strain Cg-14) TaxID=1237896 RepID=T0LZ35_COLGC|nr:hypothetical protein CGLO_06483 [Colletotrichum gloeosporioides Cg-14]
MPSVALGVQLVMEVYTDAKSAEYIIKHGRAILEGGVEQWGAASRPAGGEAIANKCRDYGTDAGKVCKSELKLALSAEFPEDKIPQSAPFQEPRSTDNGE